MFEKTDPKKSQVSNTFLSKQLLQIVNDLFSLILDIPLSISKKLNLGKNSVTIMTHAWVGSVTFSCKYPAFVEISSDTFRPVVQTRVSKVLIIS